MADVLTSDRAMAVHRHFAHLSDGDSHEVCLMARSHEELRARLERAEGALRKIADYVPKVRSGDAGEMARIARASLGAAGERSEDATAAALAAGTEP